MPLIKAISSFTNRDSHEGWEVETEDEIYRVEIDNNSNCCEQWGYFSTDDDPQSFVGADLLAAHRTTPDHKRVNFPMHLDSGDAMFIDFVTTRGTLQLAVYNAHNGYYGHKARLTRTKKREILLEEYL